MRDYGDDGRRGDVRRRVIGLERQFRHVEQRRSDLRRGTGDLCDVGHVSLEVLGVFVEGLSFPKELDNRFRYILSLHLLARAESAVQRGLFVQGEEALVNIGAVQALRALSLKRTLGLRL